MDRECDHKWTVVRIDKAYMTEGHGDNKKEMVIGVPVYKCLKCGAEK